MLIRSLLTAIAGGCGIAAPALGVTQYNLTTPGTQVSISGALFETADFRPAGTGYIRPMVRIQSNGTERGYNTSARPVAFDEHTDPNFTRDVRFADLATITTNVNTYVAFALDINESASTNGRYLSLDEVEVYASNSGMHNSPNLGTLGTLVYTMDATADNWIRLDYALNSGSGQGDMKMLVPLSMFAAAGVTNTSFITLHSRFGLNDSSNAGFEEWTSIGTPIPAPGAVVPAVVGMALLGRRRR